MLSMLSLEAWGLALCLWGMCLIRTTTGLSPLMLLKIARKMFSFCALARIISKLVALLARFQLKLNSVRRLRLLIPPLVSRMPLIAMLVGPL